MKIKVMNLAEAHIEMKILNNNKNRWNSNNIMKIINKNLTLLQAKIIIMKKCNSNRNNSNSSNNNQLINILNSNHKAKFLLFKLTIILINFKMLMIF